MPVPCNQPQHYGTGKNACSYRDCTNNDGPDSVPLDIMTQKAPYPTMGSGTSKYHMIVNFQGLTAFRRAARNTILILMGSASCVLLGHFLRQFNIILNPLAWSSAEIISALLSLTIAANVLVRYYGTANRVSLLLGLTFGITGVIHLGGIFEFYHLLDSPERFRVPVSWMTGQTLLGLLLLLANAINKHLPWPRDSRKKIFAALAIVVSAACLIALLFLVFSKPVYLPSIPATLCRGHGNCFLRPCFLRPLLS